LFEHLDEPPLLLLCSSQEEQRSTPHRSTLQSADVVFSPSWFQSDGVESERKPGHSVGPVAAVKHPGSSWGFSALLKDTSTCNQ